MKTAIEILEAKIPEIKTRKSDYSVMDIRVMNVLEIMEEYANQSKWISVEKEKPKINERVLLVMDSLGEKIIVTGRLKDDGLYYLDHRSAASQPLPIITHWQSLPEKP